jgi:hypothetical protein
MLNQIAFSCARNMDHNEALTMAMTPSGAQIELIGRAPFTGAELWQACRALSYVCPYCGRNLPVTEYDRDSVGCEGQCSDCYEEGGIENGLSDGALTDAEYECQMAHIRARKQKLADTSEQIARERVK